MRKIKTIILLTTIILSLSSCKTTPTNQITNEKIDNQIAKWGWIEIEEGLSYTITHASQKDLLVVLIDPKKYHLSIYENKNQTNAKTIEQIHNSEQSLLTFNGGFFTEDFKPTGLLLSNGKELRKISHAGLLNGILAITPNGEIDFFYRPNNGEFSKDFSLKNYDFAIQNGPALLNKNKENLISKDTQNLSSRTAIGIDKNNNLVLIILKQSLLNPKNSISLYQFSEILKSTSIFEELGLHSVLNLDGGSSTGLMIDKKYFPEMEKIQNVIIIKPKYN